MDANELAREIENSLNRNFDILKQEYGRMPSEQELRDMFRAASRNLGQGIAMEIVAELETDGELQGPLKKARLSPEGVELECIECCKVLPMEILSLLHPKRELKLGVHTDEPDFFCQGCIGELNIGHLPQLDKDAWLNQS